MPFGAESSPFILGAILSYHYDQHEEEFKDTTETLRENTYVDNLMKTGLRSEELKQFKKEATEILEKTRFPVHKWESNLPELKSDDIANPGKILGHNWDKRKDTLQLLASSSVRNSQSRRGPSLATLGVCMTLSE